MRQFGLIGRTLKHSFSKKYFTEKYQKEGIPDCNYELYELESINKFPDLIKQYKLAGLNVTIPYKKEIIPYLDELDEHAAKIDAVNTIKFLSNGGLKGFNTDYLGFKVALEKWQLHDVRALILGTGGASNAVKQALTDLDIPFSVVSRVKGESTITYDDVHEGRLLTRHQLVINTTPLGTFPNVEEKPNLPYHELSDEHMLFDLVYNPDVTAFMLEGLKARVKVQNGYEMLIGQAEQSWKIWNE